MGSSCTKILPMVDEFVCNDPSKQRVVGEDRREQPYHSRLLSLGWLVVGSGMLATEEASGQPGRLDLNPGCRCVVAANHRTQLIREALETSVESIPRTPFLQYQCFVVGHVAHVGLTLKGFSVIRPHGRVGRGWTPSWPDGGKAPLD